MYGYRENYTSICLFCVGVSLSSIICYKDSSSPFEWLGALVENLLSSQIKEQHDKVKEKASKEATISS